MTVLAEQPLADDIVTKNSEEYSEDEIRQFETLIEELNQVASRIVGSLGRIHMMAEGLSNDLRAARHSMIENLATGGNEIADA